MTTYQMTMTKSAYNGWNADTQIPMGSVEITSLGEKKLARRVLERDRAVVLERRPHSFAGPRQRDHFAICWSAGPAKFAKVAPRRRLGRRTRDMHATCDTVAGSGLTFSDFAGGCVDDAGRSAQLR